jgi:hypothetical protein
MKQGTRSVFSGSTPPDIRDQAIDSVDRRHGYTMEFSPCPREHAREYDDEERSLLAQQLGARE